jgi:hypothetical protein
MPIPIRNVHFASSKTAHPREPPNTTPSPNLPEYDTYRTSGLLEDGPRQSGDSKFAVQYPLTEEYPIEENTPFLERKDHGNTARVPTLLSRWLRRWKTQSRRSSVLRRRKTNPSSIQGGVHGQSLQYTLKRRPSFIRCTLCVLAVTLMLL